MILLSTGFLFIQGFSLISIKFINIKCSIKQKYSEIKNLYIVINSINYIKKYIFTNLSDYLNENVKNNDFIIIYNTDKFVTHVTSEKRANDIIKNGFKTGFELNVSEKRKAIYFSDSTVNCGIYARNKDGECNEHENIGEVIVNLKGLNLLNLTYLENGKYVNYIKFNNFSIRGELNNIPYDIDGTISFLDDGRIYEVALKKEIANKCIIK